MPTARNYVLAQYLVQFVGQGPNPAVMLAQIKKLAQTEKSLPLEGKVSFAEQNSDEVEKQIIDDLEGLYNDCFAIYTSPPPSAEPLLKGKP